LVVRVSYNGRPVSQFPLMFHFKTGKGSLNESSISDEEGLTKSSVRFVDPSSPSPVLITAQPANMKNLVKKVSDLDFLERLELLMSFKAVDFNISLPAGPIGALPLAAEMMAQQLEEGFETPSEDVCLATEDFTLKERLAGEFGRYFMEKLREVLTQRGKFKISSSYSPDAYVLRGHYWPLAEYVEVTARMEDPRGNILSTASVSLSEEALEALDLLPSDYSEKLESEVEDITDDYKSSDLKVKIWTERGEKAVYRENESLTFYLTANKDCYIYVLDFTSAGQIRELVPNPYDSRNWVVGGEVYRIPEDLGTGYAFAVTPPFGTDVIKVFASQVQLDIQQVLAYNSSREIISGVRGIARAISVVPKYSEASMVITTVRARR
ncbi:MAG: DUF4384 domain-containing protein, partial [Candidatus Latescibacteria bacterium]|nr:DUF4384 domain-containing protein [Candidatus Latescibacterota bacterium]